MSHTVALLTLDASLVRCELDRVRPQLELADEGLAVGVGAYGDDQVLQRCYGAGVPRAGLFEVPDSPAVLLHAGPLAVGQSLEENTAPFRFRQWLFAMCGEVDRADRVRERLLSELPDFLLRSVRGSTVGEVAFGVFLAELRRLGRIEDPQLEAPVAAQLLSATARAVAVAAQAAGAERPPAFALVATNGRLLVAARRGDHPLAFRLLEGDPVCKRCGLEPGAREADPLVRDHRRRRSVVIAALAPRNEGWKPAPENGAIAVDRKLSLQVLPGANGQGPK